LRQSDAATTLALDQKVLAMINGRIFPRRETIMYRPSWSGFIRLSLVSVPVRGYTVLEAEKARISLNQLHDECHSRIRYKKTCPIHGEVQSDQIVMGYQYGPDQYAIIDPEELDKLRSERDRSINIDKFVSPNAVDPIYFSGQTYYLLPDGRQGEKAYAVLQRAMAQDNVVGIAQALVSNREQLVLLRPVGRLLTISVLHYDAAVRPAATFDDDLPQVDVSTAEVKLAKTLIEVTRAKQADLDEYRNLYNERLEALVQSKISGKEIATAPTEERGPPTINIMDALKASLKKSRPRRPGDGRVTRGARAKTPAKHRRSG
jgi:DNA end-binding protein Ku